MVPRIASSRITTIRRLLLGWYDANRRDLPWRRRRRDPYAQWVAEVMLQQTRVETVIGYYERFLRRFPTVSALALADPEDVLKHWEGLGYYRRVQHLHRAVKVLHELGMPVPRTPDALRTLPGVGEYTSAAIASIAFNVPIAAVDGNVNRVLARLFAVDDDVLLPRGKSRIAALARQLVPADRPGDFNQAWMDLGSMVCTPRNPRCNECPLARCCAARIAGTVDSLPVRGAQANRAVPEVRVVSAVFLSERMIVVRQRPASGLWSGLWEFPGLEAASNSRPLTVLQRLARQLGIGLRGAPIPAAPVRHRLTHRQYVFLPFVCGTTAYPQKTRTDDAGLRRVSDCEFAELSVSTAQRRVHAAALKVMPAAAL